MARFVFLLSLAFFSIPGARALQAQGDAILTIGASVEGRIDDRRPRVAWAFDGLQVRSSKCNWK